MNKPNKPLAASFSPIKLYPQQPPFNSSSHHEFLHLYPPVDISSPFKTNSFVIDPIQGLSQEKEELNRKILEKTQEIEYWKGKYNESFSKSPFRAENEKKVRLLIEENAYLKENMQELMRYKTLDNGVLTEKIFRLEEGINAVLSENDKLNAAIEERLIEINGLKGKELEVENQILSLKEENNRLLRIINEKDEEIFAFLEEKIRLKELKSIENDAPYSKFKDFEGLEEDLKNKEKVLLDVLKEKALEHEKACKRLEEELNNKEKALLEKDKGFKGLEDQLMNKEKLFDEKLKEKSLEWERGLKRLEEELNKVLYERIKEKDIIIGDLSEEIKKKDIFIQQKDRIISDLSEQIKNKDNFFTEKFQFLEKAYNNLQNDYKTKENQVDNEKEASSKLFYQKLSEKEKEILALNETNRGFSKLLEEKSRFIESLQNKHKNDFDIMKELKSKLSILKEENLNLSILLKEKEDFITINSLKIQELTSERLNFEEYKQDLINARDLIQEKEEEIYSNKEIIKGLEEENKGLKMENEEDIKENERLYNEIKRLELEKQEFSTKIEGSLIEKQGFLSKTEVLIQKNTELQELYNRKESLNEQLQKEKLVLTHKIHVLLDINLIFTEKMPVLSNELLSLRENLFNITEKHENLLNSNENLLKCNKMLLTQYQAQEEAVFLLKGDLKSVLEENKLLLTKFEENQQISRNYQLETDKILSQMKGFLVSEGIKENKEANEVFLLRQMLEKKDQELCFYKEKNEFLLKEQERVNIKENKEGTFGKAESLCLIENNNNEGVFQGVNDQGREEEDFKGNSEVLLTKTEEINDYVDRLREKLRVMKKLSLNKGEKSQKGVKIKEMRELVEKVQGLKRGFLKAFMMEGAGVKKIYEEINEKIRVLEGNKENQEKLLANI